MNVVWITMDCLRLDRVGLYGCARGLTPNVDGVFGGGVRFSQCISPHIPTHAAHATMFSGQDVFAHQVVGQESRAINEAVLLLPELLRREGYFTAAVDNLRRWIGQSFDLYQPYSTWDHDGSRPWRIGETVTQSALETLEACRAQPKPFFLFLHYWDPHTPYLPPPPFDRMFYRGDEKELRHTSMGPAWRSVWFANFFRQWMEGVRDIEFPRAQYDASVAYGDHCLGEVFRRLEGLGLLDETLLIFEGDHGEELGEHACHFDHHGLYDTTVRVPLMLRLPGRLPAGAAVPGMVSHLDLTATVLDLIGRREAIAREGMQGRTLLPVIAGERTATHEAVYLTECTWMRKRAWRTERWKLIRAEERDIYGGAMVELYDLAADPLEQRNVAEKRPEVVAELTAAMTKHVGRRLGETGLPDPIVAQAHILRINKERFIKGRSDYDAISPLHRTLRQWRNRVREWRRTHSDRRLAQRRRRAVAAMKRES